MSAPAEFDPAGLEAAVAEMKASDPDLANLSDESVAWLFGKGLAAYFGAVEPAGRQTGRTIGRLKGSPPDWSYVISTDKPKTKEPIRALYPGPIQTVRSEDG